MTASYRCTADSELRGEPLVGTASTVRNFLVVEAPGPWGADAVRHNRLPADVMTELARRAVTCGIRLLMARRHGRSPTDGTTVFAAYADPESPRLTTTTLEAPDHLVDLDVPAIAAGETAGLGPADPVFLVCTHGRHDVCCAERGRPVATALQRRLPEQTWEVSHIGGDRFAGNVLVLPDGLYYGRMGPEDAVRMAAAHTAGRLDLDHLRGRSGYPFAVQAAEVYLLRHLDRHELRAARLVASRREDRDTVADFEVDHRRWSVRVRTRSVAAQLLTCRAAQPRQAVDHELVAVTAVG